MRNTVHEIPSQPIKLCVFAFACHPSFTKSIARRIEVQADPGRNMRTLIKN
jgi:hypothetical protein